MKIKKILFAVLMAVLVAALIISCIDPLDNKKIDSEDKKNDSIVDSEDIYVPSEKTIIRLNLINPNAGSRTVFPSNVPSDLSDFDSFTLTAYDVTNSAAYPLTGANATYGSSFEPSDLTGSESDKINLQLDTGRSYTLTLTGFQGSGPAKKVAIAVTTIPTVTVTTTANLTLKEIVNGTDLGTFAWNLNDTFTSPTEGAGTAYDTATLTLISIPPGNTIDIDITEEATGSDATVPSGIYRMTIPLTCANHYGVTVQEIVYIYAGLTTTYSDPLPVLRSTLHKVTYNYGTDNASNPLAVSRPSTDVVHGGNLPSGHLLPANNLHSSASPGPATNTFTGWFTDNTTFNNEVTGSTRILKPQTLFARWTPVSTVSVGVTVVVGFTPEYTPAVIGSISSFNQSASTFSFTLSVTNGTGFDFVFKNDQGTQIGASTDDGNTSTITFNLSTDVEWWQGGAHVISVEATSNTGPTKYYSGTCTITCNL